MEGHISSYFTGVTGGLTMSFIAFSIVFIVIIGLMLVMMGMEHICQAIDKVHAPKPAATAAPAAPKPAAPAAQAVAAPAEGDDQLLAVISAAIMAACGAGARVVAFSPVKAPASNAWKNVGRIQNSEGF